MTAFQFGDLTMQDQKKIILYKILLIGASIQVATVILDRSLGWVNPQNRLMALVYSGTILFLLTPGLLFLLSLLVIRRYGNLIFYERKVLIVGTYVFLGYFIAFNLFEVFNQQALVFYSPSLTKILTPFLGAYVGDRIRKKRDL